MSAVDTEIVNVAARLVESARRWPDQVCVAAPVARRRGQQQYRSITFVELDHESDRLARGLRRMGVTKGTRLALLVRPGLEFISLVFAVFKVGAVAVLIDPGMGRKHLIQCLADVEPEGFIAIPLAQAIRKVLARRFPRAKFNVTVGKRCWFWDGITFDALKGEAWSSHEMAATGPQDPAAIIFTTGSTGPPKGVLYTQGNFSRQVDEIRDQYNIRPGEVDLSGFPLFALFNAAMGVTTVIPKMDPTRPARVNPANIVEAVRMWHVTQAFGSPAIWNRVGPYCQEHGIQLTTLRRVLSAGAPVPPAVLRSMMAVMPEGAQMHTPYGATEALPVATLSADEVLNETEASWARGEGTCVGRKFPGIDWRVIRMTDAPIATIDEVEILPTGQIGELIVRGPVVTSCYVTRTEWNALSKIADGDRVWHRMGDVGYFDPQQRFWFCGRKAHRVETAQGTLFTDPIEGIFNQLAGVYRTALVGIGPRGNQRPVLIAEPRRKLSHRESDRLLGELRELGLRHDLTRGIVDFLVRPSLPVDIRHNAKIFREKLSVWAAERLG